MIQKKKKNCILLIRWFLFSQLAQIDQKCFILGCLEGVWEVSGGCLGDSGYFLEGCNAKSIDRNPMREALRKKDGIFWECFPLLGTPC